MVLMSSGEAVSPPDFKDLWVRMVQANCQANLHGTPACIRPLLVLCTEVALQMRPDHVLLRVVARALVLWDDVRPTPAWLHSQLPSIIQACNSHVLMIERTFCQNCFTSFSACQPSLFPRVNGCPNPVTNGSLHESSSK